jgi:hypothetical protein
MAYSRCLASTFLSDSLLLMAVRLAIDSHVNIKDEGRGTSGGELEFGHVTTIADLERALSLGQSIYGTGMGSFR